MPETLRKRIIRQCRQAIEKLTATEEIMMQIDELSHGRSEPWEASKKVMLEATEMLIDLWQKVRAIF